MGCSRGLVMIGRSVVSRVDLYCVVGGWWLVYVGWVEGRRRLLKREIRDVDIYVVWKTVLVIGGIAQ
jgi:hypothetical protein